MYNILIYKWKQFQIKLVGCGRSGPVTLALTVAWRSFKGQIDSLSIRTRIFDSQNEVNKKSLRSNMTSDLDEIFTSKVISRLNTRRAVINSKLMSPKRSSNCIVYKFSIATLQWPLIRTWSSTLVRVKVTPFLTLKKTFKIFPSLPQNNLIYDLQGQFMLVNSIF